MEKNHEIKEKIKKSLIVKIKKKIKKTKEQEKD